MRIGEVLLEITYAVPPFKRGSATRTLNGFWPAKQSRSGRGALGQRYHPLKVAASGSDRWRSPSEHQEHGGRSLDRRLTSHQGSRGRADTDQGGEPALRRGGGHEPKRKYQVVRRLSNLGYSERLACRVVGLQRSTYYDISTASRPIIRHLLLADSIELYSRSSRESSSTRSWSGRSCASSGSEAAETQEVHREPGQHRHARGPGPAQLRGHLSGASCDSPTSPNTRP